MRWENVWLDGTPGLSRKKTKGDEGRIIQKRAVLGTVCKCGVLLPMVALRVWIPWPGRSRVDPLVVSGVMRPWMGSWGSSVVRHSGQGSGTAGRGPARHPGLFPPSPRVFPLVVRDPLARRIPGWIYLGSQPGQVGCAGVSSITSGLGCPVLAPIDPHPTAGLGWMSRHAAPCGKKSGMWENLCALWEGVTCPQKVPSPVILTHGLVAVLETSGRPRKDGGFGICCRAPLCRQPGDGQGIVIPERCSVFLQQSRGPCRVPGPTVGMCRVLGVLLPPWDRLGSCSWPALTPRSWRCLRALLLLIPVLFFGVVCEHSSDFCSAPLHSPIPGSGTGEMVSGRGIYRAR